MMTGCWIFTDNVAVVLHERINASHASFPGVHMGWNNALPPFIMRNNYLIDGTWPNGLALVPLYNVECCVHVILCLFVFV